MASNKNQLSNLEGFVFDLDGTIYLGDSAIPGAVECIQELNRRGKKIVFISNKPLEPGRVYAEKLTRLGISVSPDQVITSARVLGQHLARKLPELNYYVVGEETLLNELRGYRLKIANPFSQKSAFEVIDPAGIDAIIIAFDRTLDYRKLNIAYQALINGARFFATNADKACPMPGGAIPDAGGTIAALEHMTGRKLELLGGKPSALMMQVAAEILQLPPERCLIVGDRLETDIRMGQQARFHTALVLTGATRRAELADIPNPPDLVLENLAELLIHVTKYS
jgi:arabinose operon protein AraL